MPPGNPAGYIDPNMVEEDEGGGLLGFLRKLAGVARHPLGSLENFANPVSEEEAQSHFQRSQARYDAIPEGAREFAMAPQYRSPEELMDRNLEGRGSIWEDNAYNPFGSKRMEEQYRLGGLGEFFKKGDREHEMELQKNQKLPYETTGDKLKATSEFIEDQPGQVTIPESYSPEEREALSGTYTDSLSGNRNFLRQMFTGLGDDAGRAVAETERIQSMYPDIDRAQIEQLMIQGLEHAKTGGWKGNATHRVEDAVAYVEDVLASQQSGGIDKASVVPYVLR